MSLATSFELILDNLDVIQSLPANYTLMTHGDGIRLKYDNRYVQSVQRFISSDSRETLKEAISKTISMLEEHIGSYKQNSLLTSTRQLNERDADQVREMIANLRKASDLIPIAIEILTDRLMNFERYQHDYGWKREMKKLTSKLDTCKQTIDPFLEKCQNSNFHSPRQLYARTAHMHHMGTPTMDSVPSSATIIASLSNTPMLRTVVHGENVSSVDDTKSTRSGPTTSQVDQGISTTHGLGLSQEPESEHGDLRSSDEERTD